jgi:hypothetical protein
VGGQIISGHAQLRYRETMHDLEHSPDWLFLEITTYFGSFTFLAIQYDQVGSPPAHRQQISTQIFVD